ncbi:MAG: hypothetical protein ACRDEA_10685, partial [Microcystaceae cyanobacterium]
RHNNFETFSSLYQEDKRNKSRNHHFYRSYPSCYVSLQSQWQEIVLEWISPDHYGYTRDKETLYALQLSRNYISSVACLPCEALQISL